MHLSGDGDVGRQAYNGLYDIRQTPDNQFKVIAPSRAEVDQQGNISITEKGKVALPDWSTVSRPEESEFEQASMLDRLARRATGVDTVQDGNVTRRFGVQDLPNLVRQRRIEGEPTFQLENLFADTETSEQASTLALSMQRLDQRIPQADRVASPNPRAPLTANSFTSILGGNGGGFNGNQADINRIFEGRLPRQTTTVEPRHAMRSQPLRCGHQMRRFGTVLSSSPAECATGTRPVPRRSEI